jgi:NIMA (never in mitosis gene a)-related kinase
MLQKDPSKRPSINQLLKHPLVEKRIQNFLEDKDFRDEFSHTLLHNQDVFKAFQARKDDEDRQRKQLEDMKKQAAAREEEARRLKLEEEEQLRKKMEMMQVQQKYKPPQSYYNQYKGDDDGFFYQQLESYKQQLQKDIEADQESYSYKISGGSSS